MKEIIIHEDERRVLIEWLDGMDVKSLKAITMKSDTIVGKHYHKNKDEVFLLLSGHAIEVRVGDNIETNVVAPCRWVVPKGSYHFFHLTKGSVLLSAATHSFDPKDDYE